MSFSLTQSATSLIDAAGYGGLAFGLIIDSAGIPVPSEILIPLSVVAARQGKFNIIIVMIIATLAQIIGGIIAYESGRRCGRPFIDRYAKYILLSHRELDFTHRQFERHGQLLAGVGRCVPVIRGYIGFVAGIAQMPRRRFIAATAIGSLVWTLVLSAAGYVLAKDINAIDSAIKPLSLVIVVALAGMVIWFVIHRLREKRHSAPERTQ